MKRCWPSPWTPGGSPRGKGVDRQLLDFLTREQIPATLFINARWIDANPELFKQLAANPLFEIANHGMWHKPASVNGRSAYGIAGTKDMKELVEEIELNADKVEVISGRRPRYYRSGTAFYDEYAVQVAQQLGHEVVGYSVLGDAGGNPASRQGQGSPACLTAGRYHHRPHKPPRGRDRCRNHGCRTVAQKTGIPVCPAVGLSTSVTLHHTGC